MARNPFSLLSEAFSKALGLDRRLSPFAPFEPPDPLEIPEIERPETLTEALIRKKRLLRLMQAQGAPIEGSSLASPGVDIQAAQGPAGQAGAILGGPLTRLR